MNNIQDTEYMQLAVEQAQQAKKQGDLPFGAVVVCGDTVIGQGKAEDGTVGDVTQHAEINALREACRTLGRNKLIDCTIYCTNEPCAMCAAAIFQAKIPRVVYGVTRQEVSHLLRVRTIGIHDLANDSGYPIALDSGTLKEAVLQLFSDIHR
jgi:tRNA(adenine34) deaminase